ncbi:hypothetical protein P167DRAFT_538944 [Morchella conica CCBAS932]|uniref:Amidohydrolase-related domain-containing protein n=1 Tax=Morchella conica CCBAS932 TaxID=1392247 RepID=A0A3N4KI47_9PEZI|nr:hypothetical protein P167DRAFT_538944 [Morchella conica CCBAS932]
MSSQKYLLDSHIHLFRTEDLSNLAWMTPENPLNSQHSINEYLSTHVHNPTARKPLGFIFLETDRKTNVSSTTSPGWDGPLAEFAFVYNAGAGRDPAYKAVADKVLGIVPWGPVPGGSTAMYNYIRRLREIAGTERIDLLKGFRYLVQFCPRGVMLDDAFVDSLRWMGQQSYVFELTVDCRSVGLWQLEEAAEMVKKAHKDVPEEKKVRIIIDHLAKPDLRLAPKDIPTNQFFLEWKSHLLSIRNEKTYIKLSGCFSELPPEVLIQQAGQDREQYLLSIQEYVQPWIEAALEIFGAKLVLWGSDWPVCTINGGKERAWALWVEITERVFTSMKMSEDDMEDVWWRNSVKIYGVSQAEVKREVVSKI